MVPAWHPPVFLLSCAQFVPGSVCEQPLDLTHSLRDFSGCVCYLKSFISHYATNLWPVLQKFCKMLAMWLGKYAVSSELNNIIAYSLIPVYFYAVYPTYVTWDTWDCMSVDEKRWNKGTTHHIDIQTPGSYQQSYPTEEEAALVCICFMGKCNCLLIWQPINTGLRAWHTSLAAKLSVSELYCVKQWRLYPGGAIRFHCFL